jgi:hypothetical protein
MSADVIANGILLAVAKFGLCYVIEKRRARKAAECAEVKPFDLRSFMGMGE